MQLTDEQQRILETNANLVINAVAGSGKTTTLIAYAESRPSNSRILYLAFNKTVKSEAQQKFAQAGITNVRVETAHSLAFDYVVRHSHYRVVQGYKSYDWCEMLDIKTGDRHTDFIIAGHVNRFISYFCNSKALRVQELDYASTVSDPQAFKFVNNFYSVIERFTREALARMEKGLVAVTHDFYLKKFQLSKPILPFDYILFDEGQDASGAMLDVFLQQPAVKVIVGDVHQQIYGWRYAINSLQQVDFPVYHLSHSFRFDEEIALVANKILSWKKHINEAPSVKLIGAGKPNDTRVTRAILGRTNLSLLLQAITQWQHGNISSLHFEGNINSYTFADEGASLYDVLNLYNGRVGSIRDKLIAEMKTMKELEDYIDKTEDNSLRMVVDVVKEFGNSLPGLINELKMNHTASRNDADMIFSTVHRCKGMEYDEVTLLSDFITEEKIKRNTDQKPADKMTEAERSKMAEEINILYVAATRARSKLNIPPGINPLRSIELDYTLPTSPKIKKPTRQGSFQSEKDKFDGYNPRYARAASINRRGNSGKKWTRDDKEWLVELFEQNMSLTDIAQLLERSEAGIRMKLSELGMLDDEF